MGQNQHTEPEADIAKMKSTAWLAAFAAGAVVGLFTAWTWLSRLIGFDPTRGTGQTITVIVAIKVILVMIVATFLVARPIQKHAQNPFEWMLFVVWLWLPLGLFVPVLGQLLALFRAGVLARGKIGAATITTNQTSTRYYDEVILPRGEGYPAALMFAFLGLVYPFGVVGLDPGYFFG